MKKTKIIASLSTISALSVIVPFASTAISIKTSQRTVNINTISWNKQNIYYNNIQEAIVNDVVQGNVSLFNVYPGLREAVNISATYNSNTNGITVTIKNNKSNARYEGATGESGDPAIVWDAVYIDPTPAPTPTPPTPTTKTLVLDTSNIPTNIDPFIGKQSFQVFAYLK